MDDILSGKVAPEDQKWASETVQAGALTANESSGQGKAAKAAEPSKSKDALNYSKWDKLKIEDEEEKVDGKQKKPSGIPCAAQPKAPTQLSAIAQEAMAVSNSYRAEGNEHFKQQRYEAAITSYTNAITACLDVNKPAHDTLLTDAPTSSVPLDATLYTNRALAHLRLHNFQPCINDCSHAIQIDPYCVKAWWRRAEAWRGLREFFKAKSDVIRVRDLVETFVAESTRGNGVIRDPGVSALEVERLLMVIEKEVGDAKKEIELKKELGQDGSAGVMHALIDSFAQTLHNISQTGPTTTSNAEAQSSSDMLIRLLQSDATIPDAFRICSGFDTLLTQRVFTPLTVSFIVPILSAALSTSLTNRREIAPHLALIVSTMTATKQPTPSTIAAATRILAAAASEDVCMDAICKMRIAGDQFGAFVRAFVGQQEGVGSNELIVGYLLDLLTRVMRHGPSGWQTVTMQWGISPDLLLGILPRHLVSSTPIAVGKDAEPLFVYANRCVDAVAASKTSAATGAIVKHHKPILEAIWTEMNHICPLKTKSAKTPKPHAAPFLATTHNILLHVPNPISELLETHSVLLHLIHFLSHPNPLPHLSLKVMTRLLTHHTALVTTTLDGWWDDIPMMQLLETEPQPASQILAAWLGSGDAKVAEWKACGGFEALHRLLKRQLELDKEGRDENLIGNLALCTAECARREGNAKDLHKLDVTTQIVFLLRSTKSVKSQKNLSIACARLSQTTEGLDTIRKLKGIELMYSLGTQIL
ncbi:hypothetical protein DFJ77DRAFT_464512 [Powellomyces hirtus]|nr:hypothetical protein DFJ77DRAFT_464512 [Powellomyces hirtus]